MRGFRSAFTILFALIVIVAGSASVIPAGQYGRVLTEALGIDTAVPGTYQIVASDPPGSLDALRAPIAGFYDPASDAANAIDGSLFVLTIGGFLRVVNRTGAMLFLGAALMIGGARIGTNERTLLRRSRRTDLAMKNAERRGDMGSTGTRIRGALGPVIPTALSTDLCPST